MEHVTLIIPPIIIFDMLIELHNITLRHEDKVILSEVDFKVDKNDFIYIIGKVGTGKSSLLKSLYGELPIETGEASILDFDLLKLKKKQIPVLRKQLGIIFQDFHLLHERTVAQNLDFVLQATGWKKNARPERIREVLELVGLEDKTHNFPHELSGGEQRRICIARALLNHPKIILADEPNGNLDPETSRQIMRILRNIREEGTAVVMITHDMNILSDFPGIVYECCDGKMTEVTLKFNNAPAGKEV